MLLPVNALAEGNQSMRPSPLTVSSQSDDSITPF